MKTYMKGLVVLLFCLLGVSTLFAQVKRPVPSNFIKEVQFLGRTFVQHVSVGDEAETYDNDETGASIHLDTHNSSMENVAYEVMDDCSQKLVRHYLWTQCSISGDNNGHMFVVKFSESKGLAHIYSISATGNIVWYEDRVQDKDALDALFPKVIKLLKSMAPMKR